MITDRHVNALALAGAKTEVVEHVVELSKAGIAAIIVGPISSDGVSAADTVMALGEIWPAILATIG